MIERLKQRRQEEGGFTLVELLVVIVILGILAAIVVFAVGGINDKGQTAACKSDKATLTTALEAHYAQNGSYVDEAGLVSAKFLAGESDLYTVTVPTGGASYTISPVEGKGCTA